MTEKPDREKVNNKSGTAVQSSSSSALSFDAAEFAQYLNDTGWTEDQKAEYLVIIWAIVCEFVALGFNIHPIQQAIESGGKPRDSAVSAQLEPEDMVELSHHVLSEDFIRLNGLEAGAGGEGVENE